MLEEPPELPASLRILTIWDAMSLKSLPATLAGLTVIEELIIKKLICWRSYQITTPSESQVH
jgi:hypothetical protein